MNKIYKKNEVTFAIIMIVIYVLGTSISEVISENIGINKLVPAVFHCIFAALVAVWIFKNGYAEKYGLTIPRYKLVKAWFFIPLIVVAFFGLIFGIEFQYDMIETILYVISMVCVGFLEEVIFRGFLFVGMAKTNVKSAIIVSSLTFGIGHIVNLFNGQDILDTLLQIIFAVAVGFALVIVFYKGKSLLPCIVFHALNNSLSAFEKTSTTKTDMILVGAFIVILTVYALNMKKKLDVSQE